MSASSSTIRIFFAAGEAHSAPQDSLHASLSSSAVEGLPDVRRGARLETGGDVRSCARAVSSSTGTAAVVLFARSARVSSIPSSFGIDQSSTAKVGRLLERRARAPPRRRRPARRDSPRVLEPEGDELPDVRVVFCHQDLAHAASSSWLTCAGIVMRNVVPFPRCSRARSRRRGPRRSPGDREAEPGALDRRRSRSACGRSARRGAPARRRGCPCRCRRPRARRAVVRRATRTSTRPPCGVNLIAFETRLSKSWASRARSPSRSARSPASSSSSIPFSAACGRRGLDASARDRAEVDRARGRARACRPRSARRRAGRRRAAAGGRSCARRRARNCCCSSVSSPASLVEDELEVAEDRGERRAQLVRDERDELVLQAVELAQPLVLLALAASRRSRFSSLAFLSETSSR